MNLSIGYPQVRRQVNLKYPGDMDKRGFRAQDVLACAAEQTRSCTTGIARARSGYGVPTCAHPSGRQPGNLLSRVALRMGDLAFLSPLRRTLLNGDSRVTHTCNRIRNRSGAGRWTSSALIYRNER